MDWRTGTPQWLQLRLLLKRQIEAGVLPPGQRLPWCARRPWLVASPAAGQVRRPRAATVHTVSTRSPRKPMIWLVRLAQVQAWNG
jgi:hypothetical protein